MVNWDFTPKGPDSSFDYYQATYGKDHTIAVSKIGEDCYTVWWYHNGLTDIKHSIKAKDWDEAKASAISVVRDYINRQALYWRDMKISFANWVEEG